jgi:hypothetical protein
VLDGDLVLAFEVDQQHPEPPAARRASSATRCSMTVLSLPALNET